MRSPRGATVLLALALLSGCSGGSIGFVGPVGSPSPTALPDVPTTKVLAVVLENHSRQRALDAMPLLGARAAAHGTATGYTNLTHPSLPNYLAIAGGSVFGVTDDQDPAEHRLAGPSVFDVGAGEAKTYAEGMTVPCQRENAGRYAVRHNPWTYFPEGRAACEQRDLPLAALAEDTAAGTLPTVGLVIPDLCHDGHDCPLSDVDPWLDGVLAPVLAGADYRSGRLAVVVTFDEVENGEGDLLTVVIAPRLKGTEVTAPLDHLALNRWLTDLRGAGPLREAADAPSFGAAFGLT